ncbi:glutathione synthetase [Betaproteobacteria bacterium UKL13-2]|jgi:glutathione synthase|nr:glutathione synthetase [Betaproteobacteria bacterium UKL13-2]HCG53161.1 glutathione synthase [Betaproteobacteria bacterium]
MNIAFIVDPLAGLKPYKDSSVFMMREAVKHGHTIWAFEASEMFSRDAVMTTAHQLTVSANNANWYTVEQSRLMSLTSFDAVLMRKDPPFDQQYLYATLLLSLAESQGARIINRPASLRDYNEKLAILKFAEFTSPTMVTSDMAQVHAFVDEHSDVILKKLDGMGGTSIFRVTATDANRNAIVEVQTDYGKSTIMAQRYIPEIARGDKRVLVINGKVAEHALARIPKAGETRGNLAAGGTGVAMPIAKREREIAEALGPTLKRDGLTIVGLDIIGDYLTEVNVTSPTCMVEIFEQTGENIAAKVIEAVVRG